MDPVETSIPTWYPEPLAAEAASNGNRGGNLTSGSVQLRNTEASIAVDDSANCQGVGIG
ncbi:hypothetical protein ACVB8X_01590 [Streptomyces sp. NRAIS4]